MRPRLIRREKYGAFDNVKIVLISMVIAFAILSIVFLQANIDPFKGFGQIFNFAFATNVGLFLTIRRTVPLLLVTLAYIIPAKGGLWNIGGEGQLFMGATFATGVAFALPDLSPILLLPLMAIGAMVGGASWGAIVGYLKGKLNVNEVIASLLLNYVAIVLVKYLTWGGPWGDPKGQAESGPISVNAMLPKIGNTGIPPTIFFALGFAIIIYFILKKTSLGYQIELYGHNPKAANYVGVSFLKISLATMIIAGAMAGFAGFHQLSSDTARLRADISPGWGYYGIVFALFANLNVLAAIIVSFFLTGFIVGNTMLQINLGMNFGVEELFIGVIMLCLVGGQLLKRYRISFKKIG